MEILYPPREEARLRYDNLVMTDDLRASTIKKDSLSHQPVIYLTHQNLCREAGEQSFQTSFLMHQTYRLMYTKPEIFILKALTPKIDLGEAISVHGLEQFSKGRWKVVQGRGNLEVGCEEDAGSTWQFKCQGLFKESAHLDEDGMRKGNVILIMSKLVFSQSYITNDKVRNQRISENFSLQELKIEI